MLMINDIRTNYSGRYHCVASSQAGVVLSDNVDIFVLGQYNTLYYNKSLICNRSC